MLLGFNPQQIGFLLKLISSLASHKSTTVRQEICPHSWDSAKGGYERRTTRGPSARILCEACCNHGLLHHGFIGDCSGVDDALHQVSQHRVVALNETNAMMGLGWDKVHKDTSLVHGSFKVAPEGSIWISFHAKWKSKNTCPVGHELKLNFFRATVSQEQSHVKVGAFVNNAQKNIVHSSNVPDIEQIDLNRISKLKTNIMGNARRFRARWPLHSQT